MNPNTSSPVSQPELEISVPSAEKWSAVLREERRRLHEDQEALREREHNLRTYESKLRSLQDEIEAGRSLKAMSLLGSKPPFAPRAANGRTGRAESTTLHAAWDKLHRARELLEAEQDHLRNDRNFLRELEISLKHREQVLVAREARVAEREALLQTGEGARGSEGEEAHGSAVARLTRAPFNMARSMLGGKK